MSLSGARSQRGSAVIEATISFTAFAMVIAIVYSVINFCVAEARVRFAVNAAVKELSTYGYLMRMANLDQMVVSMSESAAVADGAVESIADDYGTIMGAYEELSDALGQDDPSSLDLGAIDDAMDGAEGIVDTAREVADDPAAFVAGLAAAFGRMAIDEAASYFVAALVEKQLRGEDNIDVDVYLEGLGVVDGFDGIDFDTPNFLTHQVGGGSADSWNINVVACYNVEVKNFLKLDTRIPVCTSASTRAWMGDMAGAGG
ncbi:MAG: hypothetical protein LBD77_11880 [Bifidobacteriaceae bacterium]|jgi:hypothetical protein|nr:hypothetical protein [Bifidobacteriaceae bacterium]